MSQASTVAAARLAGGMVTAFIAVLLFPFAGFAEETVIEDRRAYSDDLTIAAGDIVRVSPGAVLEFAPGTGIRVEGVLEVHGTEDAPVVMKPSGYGWAGIASAPGGNVRLTHTTIERADEAIKLSGGMLTAGRLTVSGGTDGVALETMADAEISDSRFLGVSGTALSVRQGARATVTSCEFSGPGDTGIKTVGLCPVEVSDTRLSGLGKAVRATYPGSRPALRDCTVSHNEYGLYSEYPDSGARADGCDISDNVYGVYAKKLSSPVIAGSSVTSNRYGVYATEGGAPNVTDTLITGNEYGVYVTLSSYPAVNRCEITGNDPYSVYLDEQSYEWGVTDGDDSRRQKMGMRTAATGGPGGSGSNGGKETGREAGMTAKRSYNPKGAFVDFRENYWGPAATAEMSASGELVDTKPIFDFFDRNEEISDGRKWVRDRADYSGYLKASPLKR